MDAAGSSKAERDQVQIQPRSGSDLDFLVFRIRQLQDRRFLLLKIQQFKKRAEGEGGRPADQVVDKHCELEAIQRDLEELTAKKEALEKETRSSNVQEKRGQQCTINTSETLYGGIYVLPPLLPTPHPPKEEISEGQFIPVDCLSQAPTIVKCPVCGDVGLTETQSKVGEAAWMMCALLTLLGCVGGCCLIPLFADSLKDVSHECSHCHAHIHTHQPL